MTNTTEYALIPRVFEWKKIVELQFDFEGDKYSRLYFFEDDREKYRRKCYDHFQLVDFFGPFESMQEEISEALFDHLGGENSGA